MQEENIYALSGESERDTQSDGIESDKDEEKIIAPKSIEVNAQVSVGINAISTQTATNDAPIPTLPLVTKYEASTTMEEKNDEEVSKHASTSVGTDFEPSAQSPNANETKPLKEMTSTGTSPLPQDISTQVCFLIYKGCRNKGARFN